MNLEPRHPFDLTVTMTRLHVVFLKANISATDQFQFDRSDVAQLVFCALRSCNWWWLRINQSPGVETKERIPYSSTWPWTPSSFENQCANWIQMRLSRVSVDEMVMRLDSICMLENEECDPVTSSCFICNYCGPEEPWSLNRVPRHWPQYGHNIAKCHNICLHPRKKILTLELQIWLPIGQHAYRLQLTGNHQAPPPLLPSEKAAAWP